MLRRPSWIVAVGLGVCLALPLLTLYTYSFPSQDHFGQMPVLLSMLQPGLYGQDYYVREMSQLTHRAYFNGMIYGLAVGLGLPLAFFLTYVVAFALYVSGAFALGRAISRSALGGICTVLFALYAVRFTVGLLAPFKPIPVAQNYAMPLAVWGLWACYRQRWALGYALFGVASLLQLLVGVLPGLLVLPLLLRDAIVARHFTRPLVPLLLLGLFAAMVYIPMRISGITDSHLLTDREFVHLYGEIRVPHHVIPSTWDGEWFNFATFVLASLGCLWQARRIRPRAQLLCISIVLTSLVLLALGYVFVEIYPVALIAKLHLARTSPFVQLVLLPAIAAYAVQLDGECRHAAAALALTIPLFRWGPLLLLGVLAYDRLSGLAAPASPPRRRVVGFLLRSLGALLLFAAVSAGPSFGALYYEVLTLVGSFLVLALPWLLPAVVPQPGRRVVLGASLAVLGLTMFLAAVATGRRIGLWQVPATPTNALALRFEKTAPPDAVVLVPPSLSDFRLYSRRAVVIDFTCSPPTDAGLLQWKARLEDVLGHSLEPGIEPRLDELFAARTGSQLHEVARKYHAGYILTRWHPTLDGCRVVDRDGPWVLFEVLADDTPARSL